MMIGPNTHSFCSFLLIWSEDEELSDVIEVDLEDGEGLQFVQASNGSVYKNSCKIARIRLSRSAPDDVREDFKAMVAEWADKSPIRFEA